MEEYLVKKIINLVIIAHVYFNNNRIYVFLFSEIFHKKYFQVKSHLNIY